MVFHRMGIVLNDTPSLFDMPDPVLPALPYGGTSGWSGSEASRDRAIEADKSGKTSARQQQVLEVLWLRRDKGLTWKDISETAGWHHGSASGVLSVLHKAGSICRLKERRDRCHIYVLPEYVNGRETEGHTPNAGTRVLLSMLDEIEHDLQGGHFALALARIRATREAFSQ